MSEVKIRNLIVGEELPERLRTGYEQTNMPEWIWIAERDGKPVAMLVTAPGHLIVILMRLVATEDAAPTDVRALLLAGIVEGKQRGYKGYVTWVDPTVETERALIGIIQAAGGGQLSIPQVACWGAL